MLAIKELKVGLDEFLALHWPSSLTQQYGKPEWSRLWRGIGELHNHLSPGVYALKSDKGIEYIGSGIRRGKYDYSDNGIGGRTGNYFRWQRDICREDGRRVYKFCGDWKGIYTVGFPPELGYLAPALEHYLISRYAKMLRNKVKISGGLLARNSPKARGG